MKRPRARAALTITGAVAGLIFSGTVPLRAQTQSPGARNPPPGKSGPVLLKIGTNYSIERHDYGDEVRARAWGFIDSKGKVVLEPQFDGVWTSGGITSVQKDGKWGWIDNTGTYVNAQLQNMVEFSEGLAAFERDKKWGFIDPSGKVVIEQQTKAKDAPVYWMVSREIENKPSGAKAKDVVVKWLDSTGKEIWSSEPEEPAD